MKKYFFLIVLIPVFAQAQVKKTLPKKTKTAVEKISIITPTKPLDGFIINGTIADAADGTVIQMLNGSNGQMEQSATIKKGKFIFTGKVASPDFKAIGINGQPPYASIFIDNSTVSFTSKKDSLETAAVVKGSLSHIDFVAFEKVVKPYLALLSGKGRYNPSFMDEAAIAIEKFVTANPNSYITPLAIYRQNSITGDYAKLETQYNSLSNEVKASPISTYLAQQITENKTAGYGKPLADFSQADTSGNEIKLSSFKGKYVLIDFWASWCGPCRAENPNLVNSFEKYKAKNFTVLGVSLDRAKEPWLAAIAKDNLNWSHVSDLKYWSNAVAQQFGIGSIPQNFLLDPQGNVIGKNLRGAALEYKLSKVLGDN